MPPCPACVDGISDCKYAAPTAAEQLLAITPSKSSVPIVTLLSRAGVPVEDSEHDQIEGIQPACSGSSREGQRCAGLLAGKLQSSISLRGKVP
jgi:hypothetical protein